ncbi:MAG TPA: type I DNA topoisomerase [Chloroflexia bacterium]|nr:type I DNA topoisomerase [Chloroflexia bacterium]
MGNTLVIVESPAKAKTITRYLGKGYTVRASMGHVRDLPKIRLGVEVENGTFQPEYELVSGRYKTVSEIRSLAKEASQVLLATDPDREGEAIAWHIVNAASLGRGRQQVQRVEFHEITERAIKAAIANPRTLDMNLVNAQQARRVLDRLVGYKLSPLLWKKVQKGTSAGRVQSVALRIVVERERAIENFVPREFWTVEADLAKSPFSGRKADAFHAVLWEPKEKKKREFENGEQAQAVVADLEGATWKVAKIEKKEGQRRPSPPFITSTLQQEAARKLRYKTQETMRIAQQLYEGVSLGPEGTTGLITYMRTDSTQVAREAQLAAREVIKTRFGSEYLPERPPYYATKAKGAQEAHEAIRPTKPERDPDSIKGWLTPAQYQLYRLIWRRFIASQMAPARIELTTVDIEAQPKKQKPAYPFRATGERIIFPGFMAVYREGHGDSEEEESDSGGLPPLKANDLLDLLKLLAEQHFTEPPPRYGEASLVKALEELGVGRPSTYATILSTIRDRGYVVELKEGKERKFHPTELGRAVNDLLVARFPDLLDVQFTARLEGELDEVASGKRQWTPLVASVYGPMMELVKLAEREVAKIEVPPETLQVPSQESKSSGRGYGRGKYGASGSYKRSGSTGSRTRKAIATNDERGEGAAKPPSRTRRSSRAVAGSSGSSTSTAPKRARRRRTVSPSTEVATVSAKPVTAEESCPICGKTMVKRKGPYGEFMGCTGYPGCRGTRNL